MNEGLAYICLLASLLAVPAAAQDITVTGTRQSPSAVDIIPVSDADKQVKTLGQLLESRVGVQITRYGTSGSYSSVYIRGTNANQLTVYIDGMPLSDSVFGETNIENIPIDSIERIEIYRSFAPLCFSSQGIGGVINLVTKKKNGNTGASLSVGSFSTSRLSAFHASGTAESSLLLSGSLAGSKGDFAFHNDNGTAFNATDDFSDRRRNNSFTSANATARYSLTGSDVSINALSDFFAKKQGLASYNNTSTEAFLQTLRSLNSVKLGFGKPGGSGISQELSAFFNVRRDTFDDSENEIGLLAGTSIGTFLTFGAGSCTTVHAPYQEITLTASAQSEYYYISKKGAQTESYPAQKRFTCRAGAEDSFSFFDKRLIVTPRVRAEIRRDLFDTGKKSSRTASSADPQAGVLLWIAKDLVYARGSAGISRRAPSFAELFGDRGTVRGNSNLKDETSKNTDAAIGLAVDGLDSPVIQSFGFEYACFRTQIRNVIFFMQDSQYTMVAENISAAEITGHELSAHAVFFNHAEISGNLTLQFAKDESDIAYYTGNYLPHRPILEGNASLKLFSGAGSIAYEFSYAGANFRDRANSESLYIRQRIFHTITAVYTPRWDITLTAEARNIADGRTQDVAGYPLPGRSFTVSVKYIF
jgi:iron complex outermembrane receptor protein